MDWREQRNLRAEGVMLRYDREQHRQWKAEHGGADGGGRGGRLLVVLGALVALSVVGWIVIGHAGTGSAASPSSSEESVQLGPFTEVYDSPLPADPAQAKIIEDFRQGFTLWMKSDVEMSFVSPVTNYVTGHALTDMTHAVAAGKAHNRVPAGTDRLFLTQVTAMTDTTATLTTCEDGTKYREENPDTGEIDPAYTPQPGQEYVLETWQMVRRSGNWAISDFSYAGSSDPSAAACQP